MVPMESEEAAVAVSAATASVAAANFVLRASARIVALATAVPIARTVSDEDALDVLVPPTTTAALPAL